MGHSPKYHSEEFLVSEDFTVFFSHFRTLPRKSIQPKYGFVSSRLAHYNKDNVYVEFRNNFRAAQVPVRLSL